MHMKQLPTPLNPEKPEACYIWGVGSEASRVLDLLGQAGINIGGLIDPSGGIHEFAGIPVLSPEAFKLKHGKYPTQPVVVASGCFDLLPVIPDSNVGGSYHTFKNEWLSAKYRYGIEAPLLHPDFISDFLPLKYNNRYFICGAPGAGNVLVQSILGRMLVDARKEGKRRKFGVFRKPVSSDGRHEISAALLATNFFSQTLMTLNEAANGLGRWRTDLSSHGLGYTNFWMHFPSQELIEVEDVRTRRHLFTEIYGSHEIPVPENIRRYRDMNFKIVVCIRHPYDIVLSILNKWIVNYSFDNRIVFDHEVLSLLSDQIICYYDATMKSKKHCHFLRYEDILRNPIETLGLLANATEIPCSQQFNMAIWDDLGFKSLPMAPENHFNAPGVDKWKGIMREEELKFLDDTGLAALAVELGYPPPEGASCQSPATKGMESNKIGQRLRKFAGFTHVPLFDNVYIDGTNESLTMKQVENSKTSYVRDWLRSAEYHNAEI